MGRTVFFRIASAEFVSVFPETGLSVSSVRSLSGVASPLAYLAARMVGV